MDPRVRALYKEFLFLGPSMPTMNIAKYRDVVRQRFRANGDVVPGTPEFKRALAWGRASLNDVQAIIHVHKFRSMKRSYDWENASNSHCSGSNVAEDLVVRRQMDSALAQARLGRQDHP